jgi:alpha-tubulin suppressor-like RCC1 family protein
VTLNPTTVSDTTQKPLRDIWQIRSRGALACALSQEAGSIYCWGQESWKQAESATQLTLQGAPSKDFIQIAVDSEQACGVQGTDRTLYCTSLTDPLKRFELAPVLAPEGTPLKGVAMITGGLHHLCAATENDHLYCWGKNESGQLGMKSPAESPVPLKVDFGNQHRFRVSRISAGDRHTCVSGEGETSLYCFGESFFNGSNSFEPVEYPL